MNLSFTQRRAKKAIAEMEAQETEQKATLPPPSALTYAQRLLLDHQERGITKRAQEKAAQDLAHEWFKQNIRSLFSFVGNEFLSFVSHRGGLALRIELRDIAVFHVRPICYGTVFNSEGTLFSIEVTSIDGTEYNGTRSFAVSGSDLKRPGFSLAAGFTKYVTELMEIYLDDAA